MSVNSDICFYLILGPFLLFGALIGYLGVGVGFANCFGVYSYICSIFILYVSINSDICFYLILGSFLTFSGRNGLFLGLGYGLTTVFGSTHVIEQLSFSMFLSILTFLFWGPLM